MKKFYNFLILLFFVTPLSSKCFNDDNNYGLCADTFYLWQFSGDCKKEKYEGKKETYITDSLSIYSSKKGKIYIYRNHFLGFLTEWDNIDECREIYKEKNNMVKYLFEYGLLTAEMINSELPYEIKFDVSTIKILNIQDITSSLKTKTKYKYKLYEIWATERLDNDGWGAIPIFWLLLENHDADNSTTLIEFFEGSEIKCFTYGYMQI